MRRFSFQNSDFFGYKTVILKDNLSDNSVEIAFRGANVLNYKIKKDNEYINIIDGFTDKEEFEKGTGARNFIMAPYSNKISNDEYEFLGTKYKLKSDIPAASLRHGLVSKVEFEILSVHLFESHAEITFFTECLRAKKDNGYPFDVDVFVCYKFFGDSLEVEISGKNMGRTIAPFAAGWHSYFKTCDSGIDHLHVEMNADKIVLVDDKQIPFTGEKAYALVDDNKEIDFRKSRPLNERKLGAKPVNVCFTELTDKKDNFYETVISDFDNNIELTIFQQSGVTYVFTGDGLPSRARKSIAIEPVEFMTDSFNREECATQLKLNPGETKRYVFGIKVKY